MNLEKTTDKLLKGFGKFLDQNIINYEHAKSRITEDRNKMFTGLAAYGVLALIPGPQTILSACSLTYAGYKGFHLARDYVGK